MKVAISMIVTKDKRIARQELVEELLGKGHEVVYIGKKSNDDLHEDFKRYNIDFLSIPIGRSNTNPINEVKTLIKIKKVLKENNIDVLIAYGIRTFPVFVIASKMAKLKSVICVVNGSGRLFQLKGIKGAIIKSLSFPMLWLSFVFSNRVLIQNPDDVKLLKNKGLLARKNYQLTNGSGVNIDEYKVVNLEKNPVFLMLSRLTGSKGVNEYIGAAEIVKQRYPEASFLLIGPMDDNDKSIDKLKLNKAVEDKVIDLKDRVEDVRPYIKKSRIFVLPSYYPEGVPRSILEAMAMGRPIITANSPGCRETVVNYKNGFLVPAKEITPLAEKMIWMIENPYQTEKMGIESRKIAEEKFDVKKVNKILLEALDL
ncbi:glycosyltransferase family 4 protein [Ralstonia pickettii]|nr:glycosyltransferase family 4 protein [Ralstonia pickettii]